MAFNGTTDPLVDYTASLSTVTDWVVRNGCSDAPTREDFGASYCDSWTDCSAGSSVVHCTITGMDHCWPGSPKTYPAFCASGGLDDIDANAMIWSFFAGYAMPE